MPRFYTSFLLLVPPLESANDLSFLFLLSFFKSIFFSFRFAATAGSSVPITRRFVFRSRLTSSTFWRIALYVVEKTVPPTFCCMSSRSSIAVVRNSSRIGGKRKALRQDTSCIPSWSSLMVSSSMMRYMGDRICVKKLSSREAGMYVDMAANQRTAARGC